MEHGLSAPHAMTTAPTRSEALNRISGVGGAICRSVEESGVVGATTSLLRSDEFQRFSGFCATICRSVEESEVVGATTSLLRSDEFQRFSGFCATICRSVEESEVVGAATSLLRSDEFQRLSGMGATVARLAETTGLVGAAAALARSQMEKPSCRPVAKRVYRESGEVNTLGLSENADERHEAIARAGFNSELIAFPRTTCDKALFSMEFSLSFASVPVPQAIESPDSGASFNPEHWRMLTELEQRLRQEIEQRLEKLAGSNWVKQRVPEAVRKRWIERQEEDRATGRSVYPAIQYADFMDLAVVIMKRDNWREVFQTTFRDQNDIAVSLRRLHPVRKALAHSRPLGRGDVLTLVGEATRIFRTLGMRVLH